MLRMLRAKAVNAVASLFAVPITIRGSYYGAPEGNGIIDVS